MFEKPISRLNAPIRLIFEPDRLLMNSKRHSRRSTDLIFAVKIKTKLNEKSQHRSSYVSFLGGKKVCIQRHFNSISVSDGIHIVKALKVSLPIAKTLCSVSVNRFFFTFKIRIEDIFVCLARRIVKRGICLSRRIFAFSNAQRCGNLHVD